MILFGSLCGERGWSLIIFLEGSIKIIFHVLIFPNPQTKHSSLFSSGKILVCFHSHYYIQLNVERMKWIECLIKLKTGEDFAELFLPLLKSNNVVERIPFLKACECDKKNFHEKFYRYKMWTSFTCMVLSLSTNHTGILVLKGRNFHWIIFTLSKRENQFTAFLSIIKVEKSKSDA